MKAGPDESGPEPANLDPERGGLHRLVLKAMAIVLLVATASLLGTNLYFHVLGYLGGTAHMRNMFGLVISTIAALFLMKAIETFSGGEGISDFDLPRGLRWVRRTVTVYGIVAFLVCLFTNEASEGDIVPPRWLVAFTTLPLVMAAQGFSDALRWLLLLRGK